MGLKVRWNTVGKTEYFIEEGEGTLATGMTIPVCDGFGYNKYYDQLAAKILKDEIVVGPAPEVDYMSTVIRPHRDALLQATDYMQLPDAPFQESEKALFRLYRQQLRDVPQNNPTAKKVEDVEWPTFPGVSVGR